MIICPHSGLGNQIGNYVFAEFLIECGLIEAKDVRFLITKDKDLDRAFILDKFNTRLNLASKEDIEAFLKKESGFKKYFILLNNILFNRKFYFNSLYKVLKRIRKEYDIHPEKSFSLLSKIVSYKDVIKYKFFDVAVCDCYVPIKEFSDEEFKRKIRKDFTLKEELDKENLNVLNKIKLYENSVGIHIRRGDFIDMKIPVVKRKYLIEKIEYLNGKFTDAHFFVFSNGMEWAKENLSGISNIDFIDINDEDRGYIDFVLMNNCKHRIYSPSSFSSWLRYLNPYKESIEFIPESEDITIE